METIKFRTNINCGSCIRAVTPHLEKIGGIRAWEVDTANPERILTVAVDGVSADMVRQAVERAGFRAEAIGQ